MTDNLKLNVTPQEFSVIQDRSVDMQPIDFAMWMHHWLGVPLYTTVHVVVRYDVPMIPWFARGVKRIER